MRNLTAEKQLHSHQGGGGGMRRKEHSRKTEQHVQRPRSRMEHGALED